MGRTDHRFLLLCVSQYTVSLCSVSDAPSDETQKRAGK